MKSEVKNLVHRTSLLETSQNDGETKMNQMEKDLSEQRLIAGNVVTLMKRGIVNGEIIAIKMNWFIDQLINFFRST